MPKLPLSHADITQLAEQLVLSAVSPGSSPAAAGLFGRGPDRTADRDSPYIQTQRELWQETEVILHKSV